MSELKSALDANFGYPVGANPHTPAAKSSLNEQDIYDVVKRIIEQHGALDPAAIKNEVYRQLTSGSAAPAAIRHYVPSRGDPSYSGKHTVLR